MAINLKVCEDMMKYVSRYRIQHYLCQVDKNLLDSDEKLLFLQGREYGTANRGLESLETLRENRRLRVSVSLERTRRTLVEVNLNSLNLR